MRKYHPDYLGHNEYITDITGRPYQYFHYSAFGESLIEKNTNYGQFSSPYRFNGKELDPETGNYYYGARYYNPVWGIWLGVDPLAGDFPHLTPYNFVEGNPINLIDPSGKSATCPTCPDGPEFEQAHKSIFDYTYNPETGKATMNDLTKGGTLPEVTVTGESGVKGGAQSGGGYSNFDFASDIVGGLGLGVDLGAYRWDNFSNKQQWKSSYKTHQYLKGKGSNIKTSTIKNAIPKGFKATGTGLGIVSGVITVGDALYNSQINASHILDATITGFSFIPGVGWAIGGGYFVGDMIHRGVYGYSIGDRLDNAVGGSVYNWDW